MSYQGHDFETVSFGLPFHDPVAKDLPSLYDVSVTVSRSVPWKKP